jgi:hypothetical protein
MTTLQNQLNILQAALREAINDYHTATSLYNTRYTNLQLNPSSTSRRNAVARAKEDMDAKDERVRLLTLEISELQRQLNLLSIPVTLGRGLVKALLVGINYIGSINALGACINDLNAMKAHIQGLYPGCTAIRELRDDVPSLMPSRTAILNNLTWLTSDLSAGDAVFFFFAGHGSNTAQLLSDESDNLDECIYAYDGTNSSKIRDNELRSYLAERIPAGCKCFILADCCNSGTGMDLRYTADYQTSSSSISYQTNASYSNTAGQIVFLSAARDDQVAREKNGRGVFSKAMENAWKSTSIPLSTILSDVRLYVKNNSVEQTPQLSVGTEIPLSGVFELGPS